MIVRGYITSRSFMGERAPQHVQNLVIRDYCKRNDLHLLLSKAEYAIKDSYLILNNILNNELTTIDGIVSYSLFQLPFENEDRKMIYKNTLDSGKIIYFAVENLSLENEEDIERLENIWLVKKVLPYSLKSLE